jgi:hypothetical protein
MGGDGVADAIADEFGARYDGRFARRYGAGDNRLEREDNLCPDDKWVDGGVGTGCVAADSCYVNHKIVFAGHNPADAGGEVAGCEAGHIVHAVDAIDGEARQDAVGDHRVGAVAMLFVGLEKEADSA